jgi:hypothetical protein
MSHEKIMQENTAQLFSFLVPLLRRLPELRSEQLTKTTCVVVKRWEKKIEVPFYVNKYIGLVFSSP